MSNEMFSEAVQAIKAGQRLRAKDLLTRLLKVEQTNADYWLWMSVAVDSEKEQIFCLQNVLKYDPNSIAARRGLVLLGALRPEEAGLPPPHLLEDTQVAIPGLTNSRGSRGWLNTRRNRELFIVGGVGTAAILTILFVVLALNPPAFLRPKQVVVVVTSTPRPTQPATATPTPVIAVAALCNLPANPDPATPIAEYLCLTQTPTTVPIATELSVSEDYNNVKAYYRTADWSRIISRESALLADPTLAQSARVYFYLAEAYRHTGNLGQAIRDYQTATQKDASFAPAHWGKALAEIAQSKRTEALADFNLAIAADSNFVLSYLDRARYLSLTGDAAGALADLQRAQLVAPGSALVLATLAIADVDNALVAQGLDHATAALTLDPGLALAYYARGRAEYSQGGFAAANSDLTLSYRYVQAMDYPLPAQFQATVLYATALARAAAGDASTAVALLGQSLQLDSTNSALYLARGSLFLQAARFEEARTDFSAAVAQVERAVPKDPMLVDAYVGLGQALLGLNRPTEATTSFQSALRLAPGSFAANLGFGQSLLAAGRINDSITAFTSALSAAAGSLQGGLAHYWRAQAYEAAGRREDAVADLIVYEAFTSGQDSLASIVVAQLTAIGPLPSHTPLVTVTLARTATATRTATWTPTSTATRTASPTATATRTATATLTPTSTPSTSATRTATGTPTPSRTPAATRTPTL